MGLYVEVKLHTGEVLGTIEILRQEEEPKAVNHYRYILHGVDPDTRIRWSYEGEVEHVHSDWAWALVGKVLTDKEWR